MHPLHARLYAMDGSRAYLARLAELWAEMRTVEPQEDGRQWCPHRAYRQVLANYLHHYPHHPKPEPPFAVAHGQSKQPAL